MYKKKLWILFGFLGLGYGATLVSMEGELSDAEANYKQFNEHVCAAECELSDLAIAAREGCVKCRIALVGKLVRAEKLGDAKLWLDDPALLNNSQAWYWWGCVYEKENKIKRAKMCHDIAALDGCFASENRLGLIWYREHNEPRALYHFRIAADNGFVVAQYNLGTIYEKQGKLERAKVYYQKAATRGHACSQNTLGIIYYEENNVIEAKKYFKLAIKNERSDSLFNLAVLYENQGNIDKARKYYHKAVKRGCSDDQEALDECNLKQLL